MNNLLKEALIDLLPVIFLILGSAIVLYTMIKIINNEGKKG